MERMKGDIRIKFCALVDFDYWDLKDEKWIENDFVESRTFMEVYIGVYIMNFLLGA